MDTIIFRERQPRPGDRRGARRARRPTADGRRATRSGWPLGRAGSVRPTSPSRHRAARPSAPTSPAALDAGCRRFVIATTGLGRRRRAPSPSLLARHGAAAVAAEPQRSASPLFRSPRRSGSPPVGPLRWAASSRRSCEWHRRSKARSPVGHGPGSRASHPRDAPEEAAAGDPTQTSRRRRTSRARRPPRRHDAGHAHRRLRCPGRDDRAPPHRARPLGLCRRALLARSTGSVARARSPGIHPFDHVVDDRLAAIDATVAPMPAPAVVGR